MSKLILPGEDLMIARIGSGVELALHPGRLSRYGRELARAAEHHRGDGISDAARWLMGLELASKSDYLENKNLDHNLSDGAFTMPEKVYLALCTSVPEDSKTGTTIAEASYTGYARKQVEAASLSAAASGTKKNSAEITFAECTASSSTIIGWALCDALTVGNMLYWGTATSTVISTTQTPPKIAVEALVCNED